MKSLMERLYSSTGNLKKTAYLYKGDVVNPKDVMCDGVMSLDMGRKHGIIKLKSILTMNLERRDTSTKKVQVRSQDGMSTSFRNVTKEAYGFDYAHAG